METILQAQENSVAPEINNAFRKPDIADLQGKFEKEGREAFKHLEAIGKGCNIRDLEFYPSSAQTR